MEKSVYLAGPIRGKSWEEATRRRVYAEERLRDLGIVVRSPLRAKDYLKGETKLKDAYEEHPLSSNKGITTRDRFDVMNATAILMDVAEATEVSIGTVIEAGWADAARKPIVLVTSTPNVHDHGMLDEIVGYKVYDLDDGIGLVAAILSYY